MKILLTTYCIRNVLRSSCLDQFSFDILRLGLRVCGRDVVRSVSTNGEVARSRGFSFLEETEEIEDDRDVDFDTDEPKPSEEQS